MSTSSALRKRITIGLVCICVMAAVAGAVYFKRVADAQINSHTQEETAPLPEVAVFDITPRLVSVRLKVRGFLSGLEEVSVHGEVSGRVMKKPVQDGQRVAPGATLCRIDPTFYRLAVEKTRANLTVVQAKYRMAQAAVEVADAQVRDAQAARNHAEAEFARVRRLHETHEAPEIEYTRSKTQFERTEAQLRSAEAAAVQARESVEAGEGTVSVAQAALAEAEETLARCQVTAPVGGVLNRTAYEVGEYVVAGQPLVEIIRLEQMKLVVELTGPEVASLGDRAEAEVAVDAWPDTVYPAVLREIAPKADPSSRKFRAEFLVDNEAGRLRAGMFAEVRIHAPTEEPVIAVPRSLFFRQFGADFCFVVEEGPAGSFVTRLRRVKLRDLPGRLEEVRVVKGLQAGDRIVRHRLRNLKDGMKVRVQPGGVDADGASAPQG